MLAEVDVRQIPGNGGTVAMYVDEKMCLVSVCDAHGFEIARWAFDNEREALDAYRHPFARPDVPDVFKVAADSEFDVYAGRQ